MSIRLPRDEKSSEPKSFGFEGTPKLDPYWKPQPVTCKVKMEWKSELNLLTKDNFHSWVRISHGPKQIGHRLDQQGVRRRAGDLHKEDGSSCVCKLIQGQCKNQEDLQLLAHLQGLCLISKEYGLILNQELNSINHNQWQKTLNTLLRNGETTSRRRWCESNSGGLKDDVSEHN